MKKMLFILFISVSLINYSQEFEGQLRFTSTVISPYPDMQDLESEINIYYKNDWEIRETSIFGIINKNMIKDSIGYSFVEKFKKKYCVVDSVLNIDSVLNVKNKVSYKFENKSKKILGYECKKAIATYNNYSGEIYYTTKINRRTLEYQNLPGFVLMVVVKHEGYTHTMECTKIKEEILPESLFEIPNHYEIITREEYNKLID